MAAFDIVIGDLSQPDTGFSIVMGSAAPTALLDFTVPSALTGIDMLIVVVRDANELICSDTTWTRVVHASGGGGLFIDAWRRTVDGTAGSLEGDVISFLSQTSQELQGGLVLVRRPLTASLVSDVQHGAFVADLNPPAPEVDVASVYDSLLCVWSATGTVELTAPTGYTSIDEYGSSVFTARSLLLATKRAGAVGLVAPLSATADVAATGRAWTLAVRSVPYVTNPSSHASREQPTDITNPSGHMSKT